MANVQKAQETPKATPEEVKAVERLAQVTRLFESRAGKLPWMPLVTIDEWPATVAAVGQYFDVLRSKGARVLVSPSAALAIKAEGWTIDSVTGRINTPDKVKALAIGGKRKFRIVIEVPCTARNVKALALAVCKANGAWGDEYCVGLLQDPKYPFTFTNGEAAKGRRTEDSVSL